VTIAISDVVSLWCDRNFYIVIVISVYFDDTCVVYILWRHKKTLFVCNVFSLQAVMQDWLLKLMLLSQLMLNQAQVHRSMCIHLPAKSLSIREELGSRPCHLMHWKVGFYF